MVYYRYGRGDKMDEKKVVETVPVEEETTPVEETAPVEETTPVEESTDNGDTEIKALLSEVLTEIKGLSALMTTEPTIEVEEDGSNDTNVDELESQLDDLDF